MKNLGKLLRADWTRISKGDRNAIQIRVVGDEIGVRFLKGPRVNVGWQDTANGFYVIELCAFGDDTIPELIGRLQGMCICKAGIPEMLSVMSTLLEEAHSYPLLGFEADDGFTDPALVGKLQSVCLSKPAMRVLMEYLSVT